MKDIKDYEGLYAVTSCGRVWSHKSNKFMKATPNNTGYLTVGLRKDGKSKTFLLHRLVAQTYLPNPENKTQVHHINGDRFKCYLNNLAWTTPVENNNDDIHKERCGSRTRKKVYCIELDKTFDSMTEAAKEVGVVPSRISECCRGNTKTSAGYHWQFA